MRSWGKHAGVLILAALLLSRLAGAQEAPTSTGSPAGDGEKGRYLATIGNCSSCHTVGGGQAFAGGVQFSTPFGTIYSTNISQDPETGIGKWSLEDFRNAMRRGVRPDGTHLYPAFPYPSFTKLSDADIASLYAYLKTIPPVNAPAKANALNFPFNQRGLMSIWNALFLEEGAYVPSNKSAEWNRGAYLVEGLGHCGACHSPRNFLGAEKSELALTGGVYNDKVANGIYRPWSAVNLTPAKAGLGAWSADDIVVYLKTGVGNRATTFGPMNEVVMNSTGHLNDEDLRAIASYLKGIPEKAQSAGDAPSKETMAAGATAYTIHCAACHLPTGLGGPSLGVSLVGSAVVQASDPSSLINSIIYGAQVPPSPFGSGRSAMTPLSDEMNDEEIAQAASYARASWGNAAGAVSTAQVAKQR